MADHDHSTRRGVLKAMPAGLVAALAAPALARGSDWLPAPGAANCVALEKTSALRVVHDDWRAAKAAFNACTGEAGSAEYEALWDQIMAAHDAADACVPATIEDFALKAIIAHDDGDLGVSVWQDALIVMAHRLAGLAPPEQGESPDAMQGEGV